MLLRMTAVILAVMSLTACATWPSTVESIAPPNGARVGIVSSFPSQIRLATFGQFEGATLDLVHVSNPLLSDVATNAAKIVNVGPIPIRGRQSQRGNYPDRIPYG